MEPEYLTRNRNMALLVKADNGAILEKLTPREEMVIKLRCGVMGCQPMTLSKIGAHFSVTRERIRQIESKAYKKIEALYLTGERNDG